MSETTSRADSFGFARTFVLPAFLIFAIPIASLLFFRHAQGRFDADARASVLVQIEKDATLTPQEREQATALFTTVPFSQLVKDPAFAKDLPPMMRAGYATFRWCMRLSLWSIIAGVAVLVLAGVCVACSLRSQRAQYVSLSVGWQVLRVYGALQTVVQGVLLVALSFWVTALWFDMYAPKLILIAAMLAICAMGLVIKAIFTSPRHEHVVSGAVIDRASAAPLWEDLQAICTRVGTKPPDQIIAGIDDNFYVSEMPVTVDGTTLHGRTLYVSLSLLKQLQGAEASAILAHEMAHFSGHDTLYSRKIAPLLAQYGAYLQALHEGGITRPVFHFMHFFRALYELSLKRHSRQREYRADRIAAELTSPRDVAASLLRVIAYSSFRSRIQDELLAREHPLAAADISSRLERDFQGFVATFAADPGIGELESTHPFDTHPAAALRLAAVGAPLDTLDVRALLATPEVGPWYRKIDGAERHEREQWKAFEDAFRAFHESSLAYRMLPETEEERALVVKSFPAWSLAGRKGELHLDCETIHHSAWADPIRFAEITKCAIVNDVLAISFSRGGAHSRKLKLKDFGSQRQAALDAINRYVGRYRHAEAYQRHKQDAAASDSEGAAGGSESRENASHS